MPAERPIHSFETLLVANRGEIAIRVMRTAKEMGLRSVAVYSDADREAPHVRYADAAVRIGPPPAADSYLSIEAVLEAAARSGADAIHPGYGFLSERPDFARDVRAAGLVFVGPPAEAMAAMARKDRAREIAISAGVPVMPTGRIDGDVVDISEIGLPVLIKAAAGGGGKGMRIVRSAGELPEALAAARREAAAAFGDQTILIERFVEQGRHIEVQILADEHGSVIHLGERDCSVQRRHQKVIEEAPADVLSNEARELVTSSAVALASAVGYSNAGTVEFLVSGDDAFFLEMNTRLQVEHPVTEMVTGLDLVALQLLVADGQALPLRQQDVTSSGHAIEARVYAEDPYAHFLPQAGTAAYVKWPSQARVDAALESGQVVSTDYDPMLGKIIVHASTREGARLLMADALRDAAIMGVTTNLGFLLDMVTSGTYRDLAVHTSWLDEHPPVASAANRELAAVIAAWHLAAQPRSRGEHPFDARDGWRSAGPAAPTRVPLVLAGSRHDFLVHPSGTVSDGEDCWQVRPVSTNDPDLRLEIGGAVLEAFVLAGAHGVDVALDGTTYRFTRPDRLDPQAQHSHGDGRIVAPMPGMLIDVRAKAGDLVAAGDILAILEAMKMELPIRASVDGTVLTSPAGPGQQVELGAPLFVIVRKDDHETAS